MGAPDRLVVGLGNPGTQYRDTRHNLGFEVLDALAAREGWTFDAGSDRAAEASGTLGGLDVRLMKPLLFMNRSGRAIAPALRAWELPPDRMLLICDDFHLPLGRLRLRREGSHGGHNGIASIIDALGTNAFPRLRIGIGETHGDPADFVLEPFRVSERPVVEEAVLWAADAAACWIADGIEAAMDRFNAAP